MSREEYLAEEYRHDDPSYHWTEEEREQDRVEREIAFWSQRVGE